MQLVDHLLTFQTNSASRYTNSALHGGVNYNTQYQRDGANNIPQSVSKAPICSHRIKKYGRDLWPLLGA